MNNKKEKHFVDCCLKIWLRSYAIIPQGKIKLTQISLSMIKHLSKRYSIATIMWYKFTVLFYNSIKTSTKFNSIQLNSSQRSHHKLRVFYVLLELVREPRNGGTFNHSVIS